MILGIQDKRRKPRDTWRDEPRLPDAPGTWSDLNLLVIGPPGSGKMSFLMALTHGLDPTADVVRFDFEVETELQERAIVTVSDIVTNRNAMKQSPRPKAIILRYLHRLPVSLMREFLTVVSRSLKQESEGRQRRLTPTLRATTHHLPKLPADLMEELMVVFPCQVHLSDRSKSQEDIRQFVLKLVGELDERYDRGIVCIEPTALDTIQRYATTVGFHELRNVVERAYFHEDSHGLSQVSIEAALR